MDLGVVCKTHQDVIGSVINKTINQTLQTCPEQNMNNDITLANEVQSCDDNTGSPIASLGGDWSSDGCTRGTCYWIDCNLLCVVETQVTETAS